LVLVHDFIGQRWPVSVHRQFSHGPGTAQAAPSAADGSASILRVTRHAAWAARPVGRLSRPGRRAAARARDRAGLLIGAKKSAKLGVLMRPSAILLSCLTPSASRGLRLLVGGSRADRDTVFVEKAGGGFDGQHVPSFGQDAG